MKEIIIKEVDKHKKAIAYAFFETTNPIELKEIVFEDCEAGIQALLVFTEGKKVVFESGCMVKEAGFQKYLSWFNQNINRNDKNYIKNILFYDMCGFVEYIDAGKGIPQELGKNYYLKYGSLIALVWSLNGKFLSPDKMKEKEGNPVVTDVNSVLDDKIEYREPVSTEKISEWLNGFSLTKEELDWILQGYAMQKEFIIQNREDIKMLITLCFGGGEAC